MTTFLTNLKQTDLFNEIIFTLCIVGSRKMRAEDDYSNSGWNILAPNLNIYGFDADEDACDLANQIQANKNVNWQEKHFPYALSDKEGEATLYVTKGVDCSSLYPPNEDFLDRFAALNNHIKLDFSIDGCNLLMI